MGLFQAGMRVTADDLDSYAALGAYRISTQSVGNNTVVNDDTLFIAVLANEVYHVELQLFYTGGTQGSSDLQVTFATPSGATWRWGASYIDTSGNPQLSNLNLAGDTQIAGTSAVATRQMKISGTLAPASTAGNLRLRWAQNTNNGTPTVMQPYSRLVAWRIA